MLRPNNSFKPKPLRSGKNMAEKACHVFTSTTRFGLTQALDLTTVTFGEKMFRALAIFSVALALSSCADARYVGRDSGPTAKLVLVQVGRTNAFTFDKTSRRFMLLRIDEPTKSVNIPAGEPFPVLAAWDLGTTAGINGIGFVGCTPELKFTPQAGYIYTLQPGDKRKCELTLVDQDGNTPPTSMINPWP